jgi:hypothetical protein
MHYDLFVCLCNVEDIEVDTFICGCCEILCGCGCGKLVNAFTLLERARYLFVASQCTVFSLRGEAGEAFSEFCVRSEILFA